MQSKQEILKQYFGYTAFRTGQESIIDAILEGRDAVGIMPTGAGKSLCFQVPALLLPGITLVVSPLISLMKDQVNALTQNGVSAAFLNSSLTPRQYAKALYNASLGLYKIIYVAPERLLTEEFQNFARETEISMVTVDEAHCVSQWGQDFRPSYLAVAEFLDVLPARPVVSAFTATATPRVREDIAALLKLRDPYVLLTGFDRENLYFEVRRPKDKTAAVLKLLAGMTGKSGIIYCATRKNVEELCQTLCRGGFAATRYHAGLPDQERKENQDAFLYDRCTIMVATNAFGMGIDKSNVSFVIHYNMPKDLESYYQEAGRAGRDGEPASCILLYSGQDVAMNQFLIDHADENESMDEGQRALVRQQNLRRLKAMTFYCHTNDCLRSYILNYFGERAPVCCENCFNCNHLFETLDITIPAQKILSCVKRTGGRYGIKVVVDTLRGSRSEKILRLGLDKQSTYGLMTDTNEHRLREIIQFLILEGYLAISDGEYPLLILGKRAGEVLRDRRELTMKLAREEEREKAPAKGPVRALERPALFEELRALRSRLAAQQNVPSYVVFSNASLEDMCAKMPRTPAEFLTVSGVGKQKLERYGEEFLEVICEYSDREELDLV